MTRKQSSKVLRISVTVNLCAPDCITIFLVSVRGLHWIASTPENVRTCTQPLPAAGTTLYTFLVLEVTRLGPWSIRLADCSAWQV